VVDVKIWGRFLHAWPRGQGNYKKFRRSDRWVSHLEEAVLQDGTLDMRGGMDKMRRYIS
jgi:hypothetical protein